MVVLVPNFASAADLTMQDCPRFLHRHPLREVEFLSGDVKDQAVLVPDGETEDHWAFWNVTTDKDGWFKAQCSYKNTEQTVLIPIPAAAKKCQLGGASGRNFTCGR